MPKFMFSFVRPLSKLQNMWNQELFTELKNFVFCQDMNHQSRDVFARFRRFKCKFAQNRGIKIAFGTKFQANGWSNDPNLWFVGRFYEGDRGSRVKSQISLILVYVTALYVYFLKWAHFCLNSQRLPFGDRYREGRFRAFSGFTIGKSPKNEAKSYLGYQIYDHWVIQWP